MFLLSDSVSVGDNYIPSNDPITPVVNLTENRKTINVDDVLDTLRVSKYVILIETNYL